MCANLRACSDPARPLLPSLSRRGRGFPHSPPLTGEVRGGWHSVQLLLGLITTLPLPRPLACSISSPLLPEIPSGSQPCIHGSRSLAPGARQFVQIRAGREAIPGIPARCSRVPETSRIGSTAGSVRLALGEEYLHHGLWNEPLPHAEIPGSAFRGKPRDQQGG